MTPQEERWAEALQIERMHGEGAALWVAERIASLAAGGDVAGMERFMMIAARLDQLRANGARQWRSTS